jgi:hypothetical protein
MMMRMSILRVVEVGDLMMIWGRRGIVGRRRRRRRCYYLLYLL